MGGSRTTGWRLLAVVAALLAPVAADPGEGEVEIFGTGASASQRPLDPDGAPPGMESHDPQQGATHDEIDDYELTQNGRPDDKGKWKNSDYARWRVAGAILRATGQVTDGNKQAASVVESEMWGREIISGSITEGDQAHLRAENLISFEANYRTSGASIAEASVQLTGRATDVKGEVHIFNVNSSFSQNKAEETRIYRRRGSKVSMRVGGKVTSEGPGVSAGLSVEAEAENGSETAVRRTFAKADSGNDNTEPIEIEKLVAGKPPLSHTFRVHSTGLVVLRARTGEDDANVIVTLNNFTVTNHLRVY
ncbi:MAG: hypothetical protein OER88_12305, partial [Planctomycetota bacterium]|nr:hypothetical protein [Planctomycetota bacterium]